VSGRETGFVLNNGVFTASSSKIGTLSDRQLPALVECASDSLTFTAVPPGSGWRIGVDRDSDGWADLDEVDATPIRRTPPRTRNSSRAGAGIVRPAAASRYQVC
jgi:hypothetical protein